MLELANRDGLNIAEIRKESHSAKASGARPVFNELITDLRSGKFNAILTWAPDRLSRNAGDLGSLVDLMDQKLLHEIRTQGQKFGNNPNEKFLLMILCSQAKLENDNKSINVKRGLRAKLELGLWPGTPPTGYLSEYRTDRKGHILTDPQRAPIIKKMFEKVANEQWSGRDVHNWLKHDLNFTTKGGKHLSLSNIYIILKNTFYYGVVQYPEGSGKWYTGKHEPIITKELYDKVQERLTRDKIVRGASKEFAFTKLMTCGLCGSGVSAEEKQKTVKDGSITTYIYYGCSRARDLTCKCGYIREENLVDQLADIIDQIDINELGMRAKLEEEIKRLQFLQSSVLGTMPEKNPKLKEIDVRAYAKHLIKHGTIMDKRELLGCLKSKLTLANKIVKIVKE
jgi:site-specific DNA recombinase